MATNIPAKRWDAIRYTLSDTLETNIIIPENTVRWFIAQCTTAADVYVSWTPNGTFSTDNFWTIKSGQALPIEDVATKPLDATGVFFYARGSVDALILEVLYAVG